MIEAVGSANLGMGAANGAQRRDGESVRRLPARHRSENRSSGAALCGNHHQITFHHTPQFIREALETIARGEIRASDFVTGEVKLDELPHVFQDMKNRNGELKTAVIP